MTELESMLDPQRPLLQMKNAVVRRAGRDILTVDDFTLNRGEHMALLGPNGAGKSTFIHLLTREAHPLYREEPPVLFCGSDRPLLSDVKKILGIVSSTMQDQITVHLPCREIVVGGLFGTLGIPRNADVSPQAFAAADDALEMLGIASLAQRDVMTLSSGQARRVLIARAIIHNPEVLVFDEPCTGLDPEGMFYVRRSMRDLAAHGKSIILVTHYPEDIIPEIKRVLMIRDGVVFADGPKRELLTDTAMSGLFDVPLKVRVENDYYSLVSEY